MKKFWGGLLVVRARGRRSAPAFSGQVESDWPTDGVFKSRAIYLSCGDSSATDLPDGRLDLVVTDPPFFDNVHYSELADFFYAWQQNGKAPRSTRSPGEVQDADADSFSRKLEKVFREACRLLREDGLMVFTYHHSRDDGWKAVAEAILRAGFVVVNSQPVRSEMSVATPKSQAKDPIQLDIIVVCRKKQAGMDIISPIQALEVAVGKLRRLERAGFTLSRNDRRIVVYGQLLTTLREPWEASGIAPLVEQIVDTRA